jgi:hypothetical protein
VCRYLGQISEYLLPIIGDVGFLPIISILLDVFVCDQAYTESGDPEMTDSILARDCHENCWTGVHVYYAPMSFIGLVLYVPLAVYSRPIWQEYKVDIHVKAVPLHLMVKTTIQMLYIVLNKTVYRYAETAHAILFLLFQSSYVYFNYKISGFNYDRVWFWNVLTLIAVLWIATLATLDNNTGQHIAWVCLLFIGFVGIIVFGLIMQRRYPSMLYRPKPKDSSRIFRFGFGRTIQSLANDISRQSSLNLRYPALDKSRYDYQTANQTSFFSQSDFIDVEEENEDEEEKQ